jgi:hypothetical protein
MASSTRSTRSTPARGKSKGASSNVTPWLWMAFALLVVMIDQFFKVVITRSFQYGESRPVTSFFNLVLVYNKGAAFSFLRMRAAGSAGSSRCWAWWSARSSSGCSIAIRDRSCFAWRYR